MLMLSMHNYHSFRGHFYREQWTTAERPKYHRTHSITATILTRCHWCNHEHPLPLRPMQSRTSAAAAIESITSVLSGCDRYKPIDFSCCRCDRSTSVSVDILLKRGGCGFCNQQKSSKFGYYFEQPPLSHYFAFVKRSTANLMIWISTQQSTSAQQSE